MSTLKKASTFTLLSKSLKTGFVFLGRMVLKEIAATVDSVPKMQERVGREDTL